MRKGNLAKITFGLIGSFILTSNVYGTTVNSNDNRFILPENNLFIANRYIDDHILNLRNTQEVVSIDNILSIVTANNRAIQETVLATPAVVNVEDALAEGDVDAPEGEEEVVAIELELIEGVVNVDVLNIRELPSVDSQRIGQLTLGDRVVQISDDGEWVGIESEAIRGYVAKQYLSYGEEAEKIAKVEVATVEYATINVDVLNVRQTPDLNGKIISKAYKSEQLVVSKDLGDWVEVLSATGEKVYLFKEYITITTQKLNTSSVNSSVRQQIVDYGKKFLGNPYVYGGSSLTKGTDCSGFTQQIFKHFGYNLSRSSRSQYSDGVKINKSQLRAGDLVFYGYNGSISHVAIYIGNGQIIHASTAKTGIIIGNLDRSYGKPYIGSVRIIKD